MKKKEPKRKFEREYKNYDFTVIVVGVTGGVLVLSIIVATIYQLIYKL